MSRVPTPIPESVVEGIRGAFSGSWFDIAWKAGIAILLFAVGYVLLSAGIIGGFVGAILLSALLEPEIRQAVRDIWNREFYAVDP